MEFNFILKVDLQNNSFKINFNIAKIFYLI
jgi:hypothetical protein